MPDNDALANGLAQRNMGEELGDSARLEPGQRWSPIGKIFGDRFEVQEEIGSGAFAVTFRGWDRRLGRAVAIKVLRDTYATDPTFVQRFDREARAAASVSHGNVVDVYDVGRQDGLFYIVMQYVNGEDLKQLIAREGPLPQRRASNITLQILAGLAAIHEAGIIHRDIKPQNVLLGRDEIARVADFGIAHVALESGLTTIGTTVGTATYMAPEQAEGGPLVEATDLYSVGVVLYEMLTARLPFEAPTTIALILAHIQTPPTPPSVRTPSAHIVPELDTVVMRALEKRPEDRFADAPAMTRAVTAAIGGGTTGAASTRVSTADDTVKIGPQRPKGAATTWPPGPARPGDRPVPHAGLPRRAGHQRRRTLPLILLLLLLAGAAGGGAYLSSFGDGDDSPDEDLGALVASLGPSPTPQTEDTEPPLPTDVSTNTPIPTDVPTDTPVPTATATPEPTVAPTDLPAPTPTATPEPPPPIVPRDAAVESDDELGEGASTDSSVSVEDGDATANDQDGPGTVTLDFSASDWQGAYFQGTGNLQPWSAVYAQSTGYGSGSLTFNLDGTPESDTFSLSVDGMTSENWPELPMSLLINGEEVYEGTSPFPTWNGIEGEQPWATVRVDLPTSVLQQGENTVTFVNRVEQGEFSRPPYILLAGGTVTIELLP